MDTIKELSVLIYDLFVTNPYAIALQQPDGKYITKYIQYDASIIEAMIRENGSAGCYQQGFHNGKIKWVCLDFDCKDKSNPNVVKLFSFLKKTLISRLKEFHINYLTEFSGRRGIHIWVVFDQIFSKRIGYEIVCRLLQGLELNFDLYGVDCFPATDDASHNKVGKQVKFPLSCHKSGGKSFFFVNKIDKNCIFEDQFYEKQLSILEKYKLNSITDVCSALGINVESESSIIQKYKKCSIRGGKALSADDVINGLSTTKVFANIFSRLKAGRPLGMDWYVLLGTVGSIDTTGELLKGIFSYCASYDESTTEKNIVNLRSKYFPATFDYLYKLYGLEKEEKIVGSETGINLLARRYGLAIDEKSAEPADEKACLDSVETTLEKEKKYLLDNDENVVISIWNDLKNYSQYDCLKMSERVKQICSGKENSVVDPSFYSFLRLENADKQRIMVSQKAADRILTTHLALKMAYRLNCSKNDSFSYKVSFLSATDIFYNWYTSWGNFIEIIRAYIEIPYFKEWGVMTMDIKDFYDSIDFLSVYATFRDEFDEENGNIFKYLVRYNEELMVRLKGKRFGVPQGPAYARIIAEAYLGRVLGKSESLTISSENYRIYRYVDDIIIFYKPETDAKRLFSDYETLLKKNGLSLNKEKSKLYGPIKNLTREEKDVILRKNKFNYAFKESDLSRIMPEREKRKFFAEQIGKEFTLDDVAYMFSYKIDESYTYWYFKKNADSIFSSEYGRGSIFARFYNYVLSKDYLIIESLVMNDWFKKIPLNSLNFKNFISTLYLVVQAQKIELSMLDLICSRYLSELDLSDIDKEERLTIISLMEWRKYNG